MSEYTSGPWIVPSGPGTTNNGSRRQAVWTANGDIQIANCQSDALSLAANSANARLIAAAPELLEALKSTAHLLSACGLVIEHDESRAHAIRTADAAKAVIAKALGSAS
jgi:hypothetical protein